MPVQVRPAAPGSPPLAQGIEQQPSKLWVRRSIRLGRATQHQHAADRGDHAGSHRRSL